MIITTRPQSTAFAMSELQKYDACIKPHANLHMGEKLIFLPQGFAQLIKDAPRVMFIRHWFPVMCELLTLDADAVLAGIPLSQMQGSFAIQKRGNISVESINALAQALQQKHFIQDDKNPTWILSLYLFENMHYIGASYAEENRSSWNGGARKYKKDAVISRAEFKLLEALEIFNVQLPAQARALDLGAAPGGWSKVLLDVGAFVTAVDPGVLDAQLQHPNLSYVCATAQRFFAAYHGEPFDIIVNDMKMDMYDSIRIMLDAVHLLSPRGVIIMTLKLTQKQGLSKINKALALLAQKYRVVNTRQLFHNRDEVTVLATPL